MRASVTWLRELLPGLSLSAPQIAERLTQGGIEVEGVDTFGFATDVCKVAAIVSTRPHPAKERLKLVTIDAGGAQLELVCGAPNVPAPGGKVVLAPEGTRFAAGAEPLVGKEIGGVMSRGMLCSERELGLVPSAPGEDPGLLILDASSKAGAPLRTAAPIFFDEILHLSLTPNRSDALGHVGLARELGALLSLPFKMPSVSSGKSRVTTRIPDLLEEVRVEDALRCPRYGAAAARGASVGPSPLWLRYRLERLGHRSISNLVDITNYLMLLFGHPMHAFDASRVHGKRIIVRQAKAGEPLTTLDGENRKLHPDDLVIADSEGPTALAGVMGGAGSEISETTRDVLFECATFDARSVRRTSRRHAVHTDSSHRFERGVDVSDIDLVLDHALSLVGSLCGADAVPDRVLVGPPLSARPIATLRAERLASLLGTPIPLERAATILKDLGCHVTATGGAQLSVVPPHHRPDLNHEADFVEEVIRVVGLEAIPTSLPTLVPDTSPAPNVMRSRIRSAALGRGLSEALCYGFVSPRSLAAVGAPPATITLLNPLTEERSVMRTSLLPGLLEAAARSASRGAATSRLFTTGALFNPAGPSNLLPTEHRAFAAVMTGPCELPLTGARMFDFYDAKGIAMGIAEEALKAPPTVARLAETERPPFLHPRGAAALVFRGKRIGLFGMLHPNVADEFGLKHPAAIVTLDLEAMEQCGTQPTRFAAWPATPSVVRDVAIVVHDRYDAGDVATMLRDGAGPLCEEVRLFDLFRGKGIADDHRSLAFHVVYRDAQRTLTDKEVDAAHAAALARASSQLNATIR